MTFEEYKKIKEALEELTETFVASIDKFNEEIKNLRE